MSTRLIPLVITLLLAVATPASAVLNFEFIGEKSGDPAIRFVGRGFVDRNASRYDYIEGNHVLFKEKISIRSVDSRILAVVDNGEGTYFYRATKPMAGMMSNFHAPWEKSVTNIEVRIEKIGREKFLDLSPYRHRLTIRYTILMELDGEALSADVEATADIWMDPKYRNGATPFGHQYLLKTGWEQIDDEIYSKIKRLGFPLKHLITVKRTIEGGQEIEETASFVVTRFRDVAFAGSGFSPPAGYMFREPTFTRPTVDEESVTLAEATPPAESAPAMPEVPEVGSSLPIEELDPETTPPLFFETMEVRVVNVDVVVRDKKGNPVEGLTPDDFEVLENGQPVDISNFLEIASGRGSHALNEASPSTDALPTASDEAARKSRRKIVLLLDQTTLHPFNRRVLMPAMKDFIHKAMRPGDEVMIASFQNGLKIDLQFTSSQEVVDDVIDRMAERTYVGLSRSQQYERAQRSLLNLVNEQQQLNAEEPVPPMYADGLHASRTYAETVLHETNLMIGVLEGLMKGLTAIQGRKLLVFATEALPSRPGEEIFVFFDGMKDLFEGGSNQSPRSEAMRFDLSSKIDSLGDTANSAGFTLYPIQARTLSSTFNSADISGGFMMSVGQAASTALETQRNNSFDGLQTLARLTGGTAALGSNDFMVPFDSIVEDLEHYYSIGYQVGGARSDYVRSIRIKMKNRDYEARTRRSHVDRSIETEMEEIVAANLFYPIDRNDMGIKTSTTKPAPDVNGNVTLTLSIDIPTTSLTLVPQEADVVGSFTLFMGFIRADGSVSKIVRETRQFKFPSSTMARRKAIRMALQVTMDQTTDRISVGVLDPISKATGFDSAFVEPNLEDDGTARPQDAE